MRGFLCFYVLKSIDDQEKIMKNSLAYREAARKFESLLEILRKLRSPEEGCPWDVRQDKGDISRYLIEEAYELVDSIDEAEPDHQSEEMGDLLFQILFLARISEERGEFDIVHVLNGITEKMIRRHPHVFGDEKVSTVSEVKANWEKIKKELERKANSEGVLSGVPKALPSLLKAQKITAKAAAVGFDWNEIEDVLRKVEEEIAELKEALGSGDKRAVQDEIGDILLSVVNLSRFAGISADDALRGSIKRFVHRFAFIEKKLKEQGRSPEQATLAEMDRLWEESKRET
jgi:tetrapyrrole methylase family protein/MazG family protein